MNIFWKERDSDSVHIITEIGVLYQLESRERSFVRGEGLLRVECIDKTPLLKAAASWCSGRRRKSLRPDPLPLPPTTAFENRSSAVFYFIFQLLHTYTLN